MQKTWEDPLEKGMATYSSILAWEIPWIEEPGRLQFMGSQRVRHSWTTSLYWEVLNTQFVFSYLTLGNNPGSSNGEESACNAGDPGSISGLGRSPGEGNGNLLQYSCLENPMDSRAWRTTVHGVAKTQTWLNNYTSYWQEVWCQSGSHLFIGNLYFIFGNFISIFKIFNAWKLLL